MLLQAYKALLHVFVYNYANYYNSGLKKQTQLKQQSIIKCFL